MPAPPSARLPANRASGLLYKEIATQLRRRIADQTYPPGSRIPGLNELVREFGVSTITVRRALHELTTEGLLYGQQGLGVFIKPKQKIHRLLVGDVDRSIGDEIRRAGFESNFRETELREVKADPATAERLAIRPGTIVYRHEKATSVDNETVSLHTLHIPKALIAKLREGLARDFIFNLLRKQKIAFARTRFEFTGGVINDDLSAIFRLPVGFPLLQVYYTPTRADGTPLLTGLTTCRADRFIFEVDVMGLDAPPPK